MRRVTCGRHRQQRGVSFQPARALSRAQRDPVVLNGLLYKCVLKSDDALFRDDRLFMHLSQCPRRQDVF